MCESVCACEREREREERERERYEEGKEGERERLCISTLCIICLLVDWEVDYFVALIRENVCVCV